jgi:hypothetical protein
MCIGAVVTYLKIIPGGTEAILRTLQSDWLIFKLNPPESEAGALTTILNI